MVTMPALQNAIVCRVLSHAMSKVLKKIGDSSFFLIKNESGDRAVYRYFSGEFRGPHGLAFRQWPRRLQRPNTASVLGLVRGERWCHVLRFVCHVGGLAEPTSARKRRGKRDAIGTLMIGAIKNCVAVRFIMFVVFFLYWTLAKKRQKLMCVRYVHLPSFFPMSYDTCLRCDEPGEFILSDGRFVCGAHRCIECLKREKTCVVATGRRICATCVLRQRGSVCSECTRPSQGNGRCAHHQKRIAPGEPATPTAKIPRLQTELYFDGKIKGLHLDEHVLFRAPDLRALAGPQFATGLFGQTAARHTSWMAQNWGRVVELKQLSVSRDAIQRAFGGSVRPAERLISSLDAATQYVKWIRNSDAKRRGRPPKTRAAVEEKEEDDADVEMVQVAEVVAEEPPRHAHSIDGSVVVDMERKFQLAGIHPMVIQALISLGATTPRALAHLVNAEELKPIFEATVPLIQRSLVRSMFKQQQQQTDKL